MARAPLAFPGGRKVLEVREAIPSLAAGGPQHPVALLTLPEIELRAVLAESI